MDPVTSNAGADDDADWFNDDEDTIIELDSLDEWDGLRPAFDSESRRMSWRMIEIAAEQRNLRRQLEDFPFAL